ncbi:replication initiation factor domain-containing protein [Undibacterium sp. CY21W]|nr:replication initiation factor domain-containing protein [Undibacterium sp. CY21W]
MAAQFRTPRQIGDIGKFCRFYEKGRQLGDKNSSWCRAEVEFKSSDRIIPLDVLLEPSAYFAGAYPCFAEFFDQEHAARLQLKEKTARTTLATAVRVFKHQFGKYQSFFRSLHGDDAWLEMSCSDDRDAVPKRLEAVMSCFGKAVSYIHEGFNQSVVNPDTDYILALDGTRHVEKKHIQAAHYWVI